MSSSILSSRNNSVKRFLVRLALFGISLLIVLELCFRFVIIADSRPTYIQDPETRLLFFDPSFQRTGVHYYGNPPVRGGRWVINDDGWVSPFEYLAKDERDKNLIALYGDSYLVGLNTDYENHIEVLLTKYMTGEYDVYSFAMGGMMLMQYVKLIEYTEETYDPIIHVVFINSRDIRTSIRDYGDYVLYYQIALHDTGFAEIQPAPFEESSFKRSLRLSACVRYLRRNRNIIAFGRGRGIMDPNANRIDNYPNQESTNTDSLLEVATLYMLDMIRNAVGDDLVIMVGDGPREPVYREESVSPLKECDIIRRLCNSMPGFFYLDLIPVYQQAFESEHIRFNDKDNFHWNEYGNQIVASSVADLLKILD